jgi:hypothetical protein
MTDILGLFSRRTMLVGASGAAVAAAAGLGTTTGVLAATVPLSTAEYNDWLAKVGTNFTAHTGHVLKLVQVERLASSGIRPEPLRDYAFVARFDISRGGGLAEGSYIVTHPGGTTFQIFLSKGGPDKPARMLAVFN